MNIFRSKSLALAAAGFGVALCMTTTIGQAAPGFSDLVAFEGTATITAGGPGAPVPPGCPGTYVCVVGGSGAYTFASDLCVGASDSEATPPVPETSTSCRVAASGSFQNVVCATGAAQGTATITEADETDSVNFGIIFVGGVGVVAGNGGPSISDSDGSIEDFLGVVLLVFNPGTQGDPTQNQCVNGFRIVSADVALDLPVAVPPLPPL